MNSLRIDVEDLKNSLISMSTKINSKLILSFHRVAGHPLAQNERSLHVFLQEDKIDRDKYVPGKVRSA